MRTIQSIQKFENGEALAAAVAALLRPALSAAPGRASAVMLAGGTTPLRAYDRLAEAPSPAGNEVRVFLSDERLVPVAAPDSNTGQILPRLERAGVPAEHWLRAPVEAPLASAAAGYHAVLEAWLRTGRVELGLLGLGADGHTASLFTLEQVEQSRRSGQLAVAVPRAPGPDRISVTPRLLAAVGRIVFVVAGAKKAEIVRRLLREPDALPAGAAVRGHPHVSLWGDAEAFARAPSGGISAA